MPGDTVVALADRARAAARAVPDMAQAARDLARTAMPERLARAANVADRAPRHSDRARARADMIRLFARQRGIEARLPDVLDALTPRRGRNDSYDAAALAAGCVAAGLRARVTETRRPDPRCFPALAMMTSGQVVLVLEQQGDTLTVYDDSAPDRRSRVPLAEFAPVFAGVLVEAEAPLGVLAEMHARAEEKRHWFWGQFSRFSRHFGEVALGSLIANMLAIAVALFSLQIYDRVIPHQSEATLWVLAAGAGMALLLEAFLKAARAQLLDGAGRQIEAGVQGLLMDRLLGMRAELAARNPSQLFSAMREFGSVREFFTASAVGAVADLPFLFLFLFMVWSIAGSVVWVLIAGAVLMVVPGVLLQRRMIRLTEEMQGAGVRQSRLLQEVVTDLDTIKSGRAEPRFRRLWAELTAVQAVKSSEQRKLSANLTFWAQAVQQGTYVGAVIAGTYMVFAGEFTVGAIIATGILTSRTLAPLTQLTGIMARWGNVKTALKSLDQIAEADQDRDATRRYLRREGLKGTYELRGVTYRYAETGPAALDLEALKILDQIAEADQDRDATRRYLRREGLKGTYELRGVTYRYAETGPAALDLEALKILSGQRIAVMGTNGSGKSTFLRLLSGLWQPSSGSILLDGVEIGQIDPQDLRRSVGYLGQDVRLFAGTLRENLNLSLLEADDDRLLKALEFAGLGAFVSGHAEGLDMTIGDGGSGLSVGQRQSIGWARLWLQDPDIVLLDEPTAALDQTLERVLIGRLDAWLAGRTAIIATHRVPILSLATRTLVLAQGRMSVDGPRDQVLTHLAGARPATPAPRTGTEA